jgi:hypothetical protein
MIIQEEGLERRERREKINADVFPLLFYSKVPHFFAFI